MSNPVNPGSPGSPSPTPPVHGLAYFVVDKNFNPLAMYGSADQAYADRDQRRARGSDCQVRMASWRMYDTESSE